mgnify:CR=1 FL=1
MIRHIVMFRMKESYSETEKLLHANEIKEKLDALPSKIPVIRQYEVGIDVMRSERSFDVVLTGDFDSLDDLQIYSKHPEHLDVVKIIQQHRDKIAVVDYEI